jgi:uncharacterized protein (TIGR00369 family)
MTSVPPVMSAGDLEVFLGQVFPQAFPEGERLYEIDAVEHRYARLRCFYRPEHLRPGGTISGPTMMTLADLALYVAILASIGPVALAVTTHLSINFLQKPEPKDLIAECRLIKLGKRLAVGEVALRSEGETEMCAHATGTYSIPPR